MLPKRKKTSKNMSQIYMKRKIIAQSCNIWPDDRSFLNEGLCLSGSFCRAYNEKNITEKKAI